MLNLSFTDDAFVGAIRRELDLWSRYGIVAKFWWRDDDAHLDNDRFRHLLKIANAAQAPIVLAVSPGLLSDSFVAVINNSENVNVALHGFMHIDHSKSAQSGEYWSDRPTDVMTEEIRVAAQMFSSMFPQRGLSMFVPPWHRLHRDLVPCVSQTGFNVLSMHETTSIRTLQVLAAKAPQMNMAFIKRGSKDSRSTGIKRMDISVNLIKVAPDDHQATANPLLAEHLVGALRLRRYGVISADRPIGLMTHHLQHDELAWERLSQIAVAIHDHCSATFVSAKEFCPTFKFDAAKLNENPALKN